MCLERSRCVSLLISSSHSNSCDKHKGWLRMWSVFGGFGVSVPWSLRSLKVEDIFSPIQETSVLKGLAERVRDSLLSLISLRLCPECDLTTMEVRSSLSKRLMAWSRDLYIAAEILWVIRRFRSMERPSSCKKKLGSAKEMAVLLQPHVSDMRQKS